MSKLFVCTYNKICSYQRKIHFLTMAIHSNSITNIIKQCFSSISKAIYKICTSIIGKVFIAIYINYMYIHNFAFRITIRTIKWKIFKSKLFTIYVSYKNSLYTVEKFSFLCPPYAHNLQTWQKLNHVSFLLNKTCIPAEVVHYIRYKYAYLNIILYALKSIS